MTQQARKRRGRKMSQQTTEKEPVKAPMSLADGLAESQRAKAEEREKRNAEAREKYGQPPPPHIIEQLGLPEDWKPTVDEEGNVYIDPVDLHEHQSIIHKAKHMREIAKRLRLEMELVTIKHQLRIRGYENQIAAADGKADEVEKQVIPSLHSRWTKKYGLDFRRVALDTETGKLLLDDDAKVER